MRASFHIIPCGADKLDHAAPASQLYTSSMFKLALAAARAQADFDGGTILVLSAKHGLVRLDDVLEPYDVKMGQRGCVTAQQLTAQALALGIDWGVDVWAYLPGVYFRTLDRALRELDVYASEVYEATAGIGEQRHVCKVAAKPVTVDAVDTKEAA